MTINNHRNETSGCRKRNIAVGLSVLVCVLALLVVSFCGWGLRVPGLLALRNVPVFPDADVRIDGRQGYLTEFGFDTEMLYGVPHPWPEVVDFYKQEMTKRGWILNQEYTRTVGKGNILPSTNYYKFSIPIYHVLLLAPVSHLELAFFFGRREAHQQLCQYKRNN